LRLVMGLSKPVAGLTMTQLPQFDSKNINLSVH
jgi:hypothetical protein